MSKESAVSLIVLLTIFLGGGALIGGYYYGHHQGFADGYGTGRESVPKPDYFAESQYPIVSADLTNMTNKYNGLVNDYNNLRNAAIRYVGATNYQTRTPVTCNTSVWGVNDQYATTNCY